jgi:hypothetical protein
MKIRMLVIYVVGLSLIGITCADGLPKMGYTSGRSVKDLVAKGYRWVTVDGPYACAKEQEVRQITSRRTDLTELSLVEAGDAYYLIPGTLVRITQDDHVNGMSEILLRGIAKPLERQSLGRFAPKITLQLPLWYVLLTSCGRNCFLAFLSQSASMHTGSSRWVRR